MSSTILIDAGTDYVEERALVVTMLDQNGDPVNLTDMFVTFLVTPRLTLDPLITKTTIFGITIPDQTESPGVALIELAAEDTQDLTPGPFRWQVQAVDDIGTQYTEVGRFYVSTNIYAVL